MTPTRHCALLTLALSFGFAAASPAQAGPSATNLKRQQPADVNADLVEALALEKSDQLVVEIGIIDTLAGLENLITVDGQTAATNFALNMGLAPFSPATLASTYNLVGSGRGHYVKLLVEPGGTVRHAEVTAAAMNAQVASFLTSRFLAAKFDTKNTAPITVSMVY